MISQHAISPREVYLRSVEVRSTQSLMYRLMADATADVQLSPSYKLRLRLIPHLMTDLDIHLERPDWTREAYEMQAFLVENEEMLGKEHSSRLTGMNNLASMLNNQDSYDEAEQIHRQTLVNKPDHQAFHQIYTKCRMFKEKTMG